MSSSRVDTTKLKAAVASADKNLEAALKALEPFLPLLTEEERTGSTKPRKGFPEIARKLDQVLAVHENLAKSVGYDHDAVIEDLDNAQAIDTLTDRAERLAQLLSDAKLEWLSQAMHETIPAYHAAKTQAKFDGSLAEHLEPITDFYAKRAKSTPKPSKE